MKISTLKKVFVGRPLATAQARHERLSKGSALAVFASDALSSVAYATEEILLILVLAGTVALGYAVPIGVAICLLIAVVTSSYRQTILAYPQGGGAYIVTKDNLGTLPSLAAGAALLVDYVLTVAVSVAAGIAALTSAFPAALRLPRAARRALHRRNRHGQPAGHPRVGGALRPADLSLHRELSGHARRTDTSAGSSAGSCRHRPSARPPGRRR